MQNFKSTTKFSIISGYGCDTRVDTGGVHQKGLLSDAEYCNFVMI